MDANLLKARRRNKVEFLNENNLGDKHGKLTILKFTMGNGNDIVCSVKCDCGKKKELIYSSLKSSNTLSCGCLQKEITIKNATDKRRVFLNQKFGKLTILEFTRIDVQGVFCLTKCDCGNTKELRFSSIKSGAVVSCGCYNIYVHSTHSLSKHPLHRIWSGLKRRCYYEKGDNFKNYGAIGITVCDEWKENFLSFYKWAVDNKWEKGLQVDRYPDKYGNYSPENCRICTGKVNCNNKRNNRILNVEGELMTFKQVCEKFSIKESTLSNRLKSGLMIYEALHVVNRNKKNR